MGDAKPFRLLPRVDDTNEFFWTGGKDGEVRFLRCQTCGYYIHPPSPICPKDLSRDLAPSAVSGRATVHTFTVIRQNYARPFRDLVPYVVAMIELEEGPMMMGNLSDVDLDDVRVGLPVEVWFEPASDDVALPFWRPRSS